MMDGVTLLILPHDEHDCAALQDQEHLLRLLCDVPSGALPVLYASSAPCKPLRASSPQEETMCYHLRHMRLQWYLSLRRRCSTRKHMMCVHILCPRGSCRMKDIPRRRRVCIVLALYLLDSGTREYITARNRVVMLRHCLEDI